MNKEYSVAVIFGGISGENEVSVITGAMVCNVLKKGGESVLPVYIDHGGNMLAGEELADVTKYKRGAVPPSVPCAMENGGFVTFNKRGKPCGVVKAGCILNCCHGGGCEGGAVAGAAFLNNIPFASAGLFESATFMDKYYTKLVLQSLEIKTAKYAYSRDITGAIAKAEGLGYPLIVKPATLGSSIGIAKAENKSELMEALSVAFELDGGVLLEEYFSDRKEVNCAAYFAEGKVVVSPCEEVASDGAILSYDDKYSGGGRRVFPAELDDGISDKIRGTTARVYSELAMRGAVRFDYIISGGEVYLSEVNTVPGSLSQYLLSQSYRDFYSVLRGIIVQAKIDFKESRGKRVISTGILNGILPVNGKLK